MHLPQLKNVTNQLQPSKMNSLLDIKQKFQQAISNVCMNVLWDAVSSADTDRLRDTLDFSTHFRQTLEGGHLLWYAMRKGYLQMAKMLIHAGAYLHVRDPECPQEHRSFLHFLAARSHDESHVELALLVLEHGADADAKDAGGKSVLYYAVRCRSTVLVRELLRRNATDSPGVLALAASQRDPDEMLELLVYSCDDEEARNERAFFVAEYYIDHSTNTKPLEKVLERGLPVDYANRSGWTLLHYAVTGGDDKMVNLLLERGANANLQICYGAPLHLASFRPRATIPIMLIKGGADIHAQKADGRYPIHSACYKQSACTIDLLLDLGADVNAVDGRGQTPFSLIEGDDSFCAKTVVIQRIALLTSLDRSVDKRDLVLIESCDETRSYFESCLDELEDAKKRKVFDHVSYYSILEKGTTRMSLLVRNKEFLEMFESNDESMAGWFPVYSSYMVHIVEIAKRKKELLHFTEMYLGGIFGGTMPFLVLEKIAFILCEDELKNVEREYYLLQHEIHDLEIEFAERSDLRKLLDL